MRPEPPPTNIRYRRWVTDEVVYTGTLVAWNGGATHTQSGDRVWWFDFSSLSSSGNYYVHDLTNNVSSYQFDIGDNAYDNALRQTVRSFYYQRCGTAKLAAHAGTGWSDGTCHIGIQQDSDCRLYNNTNISTSKNLSGGWHDAGDYNKYVNFTWEAMVNLLLAYEDNPSVWTDDLNIPESGNNVPDLLDELKFELDWLLKMQNSNGSVISVIGGGSASPPSSDSQVRRYGPATTSASFTASSIFALASIQFASLGIPSMTAYAASLRTASENAWTWANANPSIKFFNSGVLAAGENELSSNVDDYNYELLMRKLSAASFLYALTGSDTYKTFFESNYAQAHLIAWSYAYPFETTTQEFLLYYTKLAGISPAVATTIKTRYSNSMVTGNADNLPARTNSTDAYRAYLSNNNYTWGSSSVKCRQALMFLNMNRYSMSTTNATDFTDAASGYLHFMHGINPFAFTFITNMSAYGAENSVNEIYHNWFADESSLWDRVGVSTHGPAPGLIPGGINPNWALDGCCPAGCGSVFNNNRCVLANPPSGQPIQKSYKDWNANWPQNSWSITENGIYYNASYIRLVSNFISSGSCSVPLSTSEKAVPAKWNTKVSPNPFTGFTQVTVFSQVTEPIQVRVLSSLGVPLTNAIWYSTNVEFEIGEMLPDGILLLEIKKLDNTSAILKLIKN